jgi:para-nitrobenzyl esterase
MNNPARNFGLLCHFVTMLNKRASDNPQTAAGGHERHSFFRSRLLVLLVLLAGAGSMQVAADPVLTNEGLVQGITFGQVEEFLGIPYATPPLGNLRWRAPLPPQAHQAVLQATTFAAPCFRAGGASGSIPAPSEDCLYLNIYRPLGSAPGQAKPVLVYIHGGGFGNGSGAGQDGTPLVLANDMLVVMINYRLGALGWLVAPALDAETIDGASSGNYGLLDMVAALRWLNQNVGAFGGNPNNVTIAGTSAGGIAVCALITAQGAAGLFNRGIIESGECTKTSVFIATHQNAAAQGQTLVSRLGCTNPATAAACLRSAGGASILSAASGLSVSTANIGGALMAMHPIDAFAQARFIVPVMIGANHDETRSSVLATTGFPATVQTYQQYLNNSFGALAALVATEYPLGAYSDPAYAAGAASSDSGFPSGIGVCPMLVEQANALARVTKTWAYELNDPNAGALSAVPPGFEVGSEHVAEAKFLYNSAVLPTSRTPAEQMMGDQVLHYWGAFAHGSFPTDGNLTWPLYNFGQQVIRFQPTGNVLVPMSLVSNEHHCAFWAGLGF